VRAADQLAVAGRQHRAQTGDVDLEGALGAARLFLRPQQLDQAVGGHGLAGLQQQDREQQTLLPALQLDLLPSRPDLDRTKQSELHEPQRSPALRRRW
jgi:hypothetical protein